MRRRTEENEMKAFDCVNKQEVEISKADLINLMKNDRQIDMKFA